MQSWQILFHFILRSARNLVPGDNLSLLSPNSAWRCRGLTWDGTVSTPNRCQKGCGAPAGRDERGKAGAGGALGSGRGSRRGAGLTSRVHGRLRNHMCPSEGREEPSPRCATRRPGGHGPTRDAPAVAARVASSTLPGSTAAQWQPPGQDEPHRLSAAASGMGTETGIRKSGSEGGGGMEAAGSRAEVCEGEAGSEVRGAQRTNASFTHYI